jgi:hypothetical protein
MIGYRLRLINTNQSPLAAFSCNCVCAFMNIYDDLGDTLKIEMDCLLFTDVYASLTDEVRAQQEALLEPISRAIS